MPMSSPQMTRMFGWVALEGVPGLADFADLAGLADRGIARLLLVSDVHVKGVVDLHTRSARASRTIGNIPAPAPLGLSPTVGIAERTPRSPVADARHAIGGVEAAPRS